MNFTNNSLAGCDQDVREPGTITSPNYPDDYPSSSLCWYNITSPNDLVVSLDITDFQLESSYDYLYVYDGPNEGERLIGSYTGTLTNIPLIISSGRSLYLVFDTDSSIQQRGFSADIMFQEPPGKYSFKNVFFSYHLFCFVFCFCFVTFFFLICFVFVFSLFLF